MSYKLEFNLEYKKAARKRNKEQNLTPEEIKILNNSVRKIHFIAYNIKIPITIKSKGFLRKFLDF